LKNAIEFNEAFMGAGNPLKGSRIPGFGAGNRTPQTSRVHRSKAKGTVPVKAVRKGLARSAVAVIRIDPRTYEVRVKGTRALVGMVRKIQGAGGKAYSYQIPGDKAHKGFASQNAAVARMLEKV
jgi:CYTH domain-containing protein